ncbi:hypothetical protein DUZ99_10750 [Xylanibacillus composti]|uniref:Uncharacterized protein n=1 Tax=Xylanibacillus composti TaxID=1572762 RepID=A0A8J4H759_9BACL|nr:DUF3939 domain-containing protein [Xylanibacillus composti]MDT9725449.1 hypothetical protein [Xylanibacillus composti]GIQ71035.1 hypothetical protein XYCOK13_38590 [Xylanibacillus composti]
MNAPAFRMARTPIAIMMILALLSGCMYPGDTSTADQRIAAKEDVVLVQAAVNEYMQETGVLPIQNSDMSVPKYEKFKIDFGKLTNGPFLSRIPNSAFESGGRHLYLIVEEGEELLVRLMDVHVFQQVTDLEAEVRRYKQANNGEVPLQLEVSPGWYSIDYDALRVDRLQVTSMFTGALLPILINTDGELAVDYAPDIMELIRKQADDSADGADASDGQLSAAFETRLAEMEDLRSLLVEEHLYVPVKSRAYIWADGQPIISNE